MCALATWTMWLQLYSKPFQVTIPSQGKTPSMSLSNTYIYICTVTLCAFISWCSKLTDNKFTSVIFQIIAFDELRTDFKNPIDQSNPTRAVRTLLHVFQEWSNHRVFFFFRSKKILQRSTCRTNWGFHHYKCCTWPYTLQNCLYKNKELAPEVDLHG